MPPSEKLSLIPDRRVSLIFRQAIPDPTQTCSSSEPQNLYCSYLDVKDGRDEDEKPSTYYHGRGSHHVGTNGAQASTAFSSGARPFGLRPVSRNDGNAQTADRGYEGRSRAYEKISRPDECEPAHDQG